MLACAKVILDPLHLVRPKSLAAQLLTHSNSQNTSTMSPIVLKLSNQLRMSVGTHRTHLRTPMLVSELGS